MPRQAEATKPGQKESFTYAALTNSRQIQLVEVSKADESSYLRAKFHVVSLDSLPSTYKVISYYIGIRRNTPNLPSWPQKEMLRLEPVLRHHEADDFLYEIEASACLASKEMVAVVFMQLDPYPTAEDWWR